MGMNLFLMCRQMLLIFKMNDCLRHVDYALGSPTNTLVRFLDSSVRLIEFYLLSRPAFQVVAGKYASERVYNSDKRRLRNGRFLDMFRSWLSYMNVMLRIKTYELWRGLFITYWKLNASTGKAFQSNQVKVTLFHNCYIYLCGVLLLLSLANTMGRMYVRAECFIDFELT